MDELESDNGVADLLGKVTVPCELMGKSPIVLFLNGAEEDCKLAHWSDQEVSEPQREWDCWKRFCFIVVLIVRLCIDVNNVRVLIRSHSVCVS